MRDTLITNRARAMRKAMTEPEVMLWSRLRRRGERPTFRRQHPFGSIILDFYCPALRFAVEVDGSVHWDGEARLRDARRDRWLAKQGVTVMRVPAGWIYRDLGGVMDAIFVQVEALQRAERPGPPLAPSTPRSPAG